MSSPRCADADRLPCYLLLDIHEILSELEKKNDAMRNDIMEMGVKLSDIAKWCEFTCDEKRSNGGEA